MTKLIAITAAVVGIAIAQPAQAYDGLTSELSHVAGGMVMAGTVTAIADHYHMENRALIGFGVSTAFGILTEAIQMAADKDTKLSSSALDAGSFMLGASIGAAVTDHYIITPMVELDRSGHARVGVVARHAF